MAGPSDAQALLLTVSADTSKAVKALDALNKKLSDIGPDLESKAKKSAGNIEKAFGEIDIGKAFDNVISRSRFAVLEEGGQKLSVFGSALEDLGPAGLVAAAGLAALGVGLEETHKALEYADGLYKAAAAAHVSTDELQKYQVALGEAGGNAQEAGGALTGFSETLGKAQEGLTKSQKAFLALGFTPAQIKGFRDTGDAMAQVIERIGELRSKSQQDAAIEQLGLAGLKPLILANKDAQEEYLAASSKTGQTLQTDVIDRAHQLNDEVEALSRQIKNELTTAFVDLGPVLVKLLGLVAQLLDKTEGFFDKLSPIQKKVLDDLNPLSGYKGIQALPADLYDMARGRNPEAAADGKPAAEQQKPGTRKLIDQSPQVKNDTAERSATADAALAEANKALLTATNALTGDILARADAEAKIVDEELNKTLAQLSKQAAEIAGDKGITQASKDRLTAELDLARTAQTQAAGAKKALIARQADWAVEDQIAAASKAQRETAIADLNLAAQKAPTAVERNALTDQALKIQQNQDLQDYARTLSRQQQTGQITDARGTQLFSDFKQRQSDAAQTKTFNDADPVTKYLRSVQDLNTEFQTDGVTAARSLASGLADAIVNAKNLGDVARSVFQQLISDVLKDVLEKNVTSPLASLVSGGLGSLLGVRAHAAGTNNAPGGLTLVGEKGPELLNIRAGTQVIPNDILRGLSRKGGAISVSTPIYIDATGADAAGLARVSAQLDNLQRSLPSQVTSIVRDGVQRRTIGA